MSLIAMSGGARLRVRPGVGAGAQLRSFSTPEWKFLLGPQVVPGTYSATGITNMESSLTARAAEFETRCTSVEGFAAGTGTIAVTDGSVDIVGTGTTFTGLTGRGIRIPDAGFADGYRYFLIQSVQSATTAKLGVYTHSNGTVQTATWAGGTASGVAFAINTTTTDGDGNAAGVFNDLYNYYDTVLGLYQGWAKSDNMAGGSSILASARAIADHLADTHRIGGWVLPSNGAVETSPRTAALIGFVCRAHDGGKTAWFDGFKEFVDEQNVAWLTWEATGGSRAANASLYSVRDAAYMLMFNAVLGVVHPNTTSRNTFRDAAIAFAIDPVKRKKNDFATGYTRWKNTELGSGGEHLTASDGTTVVDFHQPFINALMIEALIWVHRMMRFHGTTSGADYDDISTMIVQGVRGWYASYQQASNGYNANLRGQSYFTGEAGERENGGTTLTVTTPPGTPFAIGATTLPGNPTYPTDWDKIMATRQLNATGLGNIGYAHALSPGSEFLNMYHEVLASCFGAVGHSGTSTYSSFWPITADGANFDSIQRNWNQHHRFCQRAPAWIAGGLETF